MESTLTLKFKGAEASALNEMIQSGLFNSKSEAVRASLVHYSTELLSREQLWKKIESFPSRKISPRQLARELEELEDSV